jgi:hypothetical protein
MSTIWELENPFNPNYASPLVTGEWASDELTRIQPTVVEWEERPNEAGDFIWAGYSTELFVRESVKVAIETITSKVNFVEPVISERSRFTSGYPIFEVEPKIVKREDRSRSTIGPDDFFEDAIKIIGVEEYSEAINAKNFGKPLKKTKRKPGHGIFIKGKCHLFRTALFPRSLFCSDKFRSMVLQQKFSNIEFFEVGDFF